MKIGDIFLVKVYEKVVPAILLEVIDGLLFVAQIKPHTLEPQKSTLLIGQPEGLRSKSVIMLYRTYTISALDIVKNIATIDNPKSV